MGLLDLQGTVIECLMSPFPWPRLVVGKSQVAVGPVRAEADVQKFPCQEQVTLGVCQEASYLIELRGYCVFNAKSFT